MIIPVGNRLLVKPTAPDETSKGGLLLKKIDDEKQNSGIVVGVGQGDQVFDFKPGDFVIFFRYGPQEVLVENEKHLSVHIDEVIAMEVRS